MQPDEIKAYAEEVAKKLGETDKKPLEQIELLLQHAGKEFVDENVAESFKIEEEGGMFTEDKKRRRTVGGIFFYIAKGKLDPEVRGNIFPGYGQNKPVGKVVAWDERLDYIKPLLEGGEHGEMRFVTVTLQGRPGKLVIEDNSVMTTISHSHSQTPLPRGVPHPPDDATLYTVYMAHKQYETVVESLEKYKNDWMLVEGTLFYDKETNTMAVLASRVSTKRIDKMAKRDEEEGEKKDAKPAKVQKEDSRKPPKQTKGTPPPKPLRPMKPIPQPKPQIEIEVPAGTPPDVAEKLRQLYSAAETLRERIATMEQKGQSGVAMTKKLLMNTERQIEALERQFTS